MFTFDTLALGLSLGGIKPAQVVTVVATVSLGNGAVQAIYKTADGALKERLVTRADEPTINIATAERPRSFDGEKDLPTAAAVLPLVARECYERLFRPHQPLPTDTKSRVEAFTVNTSGSALGNEIERVCIENELMFSTSSLIHLRAKLGDYTGSSRRLTGAP